MSNGSINVMSCPLVHTIHDNCDMVTQDRVTHETNLDFQDHRVPPNVLYTLSRWRGIDHIPSEVNSGMGTLTVW